jgi:hypothetical protein
MSVARESQNQDNAMSARLSASRVIAAAKAKKAQAAREIRSGAMRNPRVDPLTCIYRGERQDGIDARESGVKDARANGYVEAPSR